jgi:excisionase family DNA binding protein
MSISSTGLSRDERSGASLPPLTVTVKQALALLNIGNTKMYELIGNGTVKTVQIGRRRLIVFTSLSRLVEQSVEAE